MPDQTTHGDQFNPSEESSRTEVTIGKAEGSA